MSYSQSNEESLILEFFKDKNSGFFLDIGAGDGIRLSNTRALYERGWSGMLIEPLYSSFQTLAANYAFSERATLLNAAVSDKNGPVQFSECYDSPEWSSLDPRWTEGWKDKAITHFVFGIRLDSLGLPPCVDLLNIDTEGHDLAILRTIPESIRPRLIVSEIDKFDDGLKIDALLKSFGYVPEWTAGANGAWSFPNYQLDNSEALA